jgi:hypothetical protein
MGATKFFSAMFLGATAVAMLVPRTGAQAQFWHSGPEVLVWHGNDTGGIIPWSCENEAVARQAAAGYCAQFNKYGRITGVNRQYGDFISFNCLWAPKIERYARPAVAMRTTCVGPPQHFLTK